MKPAPWILAACLAPASLPHLRAQSRPINTGQSKVSVRVFKSGWLPFAHDHTIDAPISQGTLDSVGRAVALSFRVLDMKVVDPGISDKDRAEIDRTMKSDKVLDAERNPEIYFISRAVEEEDATHLHLRGDLTVRGTTRPVEMPVTLVNGRYAGSLTLKQTDFGITPVAVAGGAVKVKDRIEIVVEIVPGS